MAEWTSAGTFAERVANPRGTGGGPRANGDYFLKVSGPDMTVYDDGAVDGLQSASGSDWYFANLSGILTRAQADELSYWGNMLLLSVTRR
jgi:hypothetical protein